MNKLFFLIILLTLIGFASCVYAGENNTISEYDLNESVVPSSDVVYALEDGHLNTSFSDGSNGYCIEYREQEASVGDKFYKTHTDYYSSGKYLKTYFLRYYTHTQIDPVVTQHMIWHFTDNFDGWRLNYTIINDVKNNPLDVDDNGLYKLNKTHSLYYNFNVLLSPYEHHQDYFTYFIELVTNECLDNNVSVDNVVNGSVEDIFLDINLIETIINHTFPIYEVNHFNKLNMEDNVNCKNIQLNKYVTGYEVKIITLILLLLILISIIKNRKNKIRKIK